MRKTPGQIAKEAYGAEFRKSESWNAAANAVLEEAAKVADDIATNADKACGVEFDRAMRWHLADRRNLAIEFAKAIRSLKVQSDLCQADHGAKGEDGVAPEGALQADLGAEA